MEHQANLLWINSDSSYNIHEKWLQQHFKKNERPQILIVKSENILTPENIQKVSWKLPNENNVFISLFADVWNLHKNPVN